MRVTYDSLAGQTVEGTLRPGSFTLALGLGQRVVSCDDEGRPWTLWRDDRTLRRGYSGRVMEVWKGADGVRRHRDVPHGEWLHEWEDVRAQLAADLDGPVAAVPALAERIGRAAAFDPERLDEDARRYRDLYGAIGILPPDAYLSVVLQPVVGCPYNRCTFCDFYQHVPFSILDVPAFEAHVEAVLAYLGRALPMRRGVFLADADALAVPDDHLLGYLRTIRDRLPHRAVSAFTTPFLGRGRAPEVYREARALGLHRVHLGVESGSEAVLKLLGKPRRTDVIRAQIGRLKAGGLSVGVILMVGAGGASLAAEHVDASVALVRELGLGRDDLVYLSPMVLDGRTRYTERAEALGTAPLDELALSEQDAVLREALRRPDGPKVARYDIRDFLD